MSTVTFRIEGLTLHAHHGAYEAERSLGQRFRIDLVLSAELGAALLSDEAADSVDYSAVIEAASAVFTGRRFKLIEAAAHAVAEELLSRFAPVSAVTVTIHKPSAPVKAVVSDISATVERRRP